MNIIITIIIIAKEVIRFDEYLSHSRCPQK